MRRALLVPLLMLAACGGDADVEAPGMQAPGAAAVVGVEVPMAHARTFRVTDHDGYRIVDMRASIITWGGDAKGPEQSVRLLLVPRDGQVPSLTGDLAGATVVRTPVQRIAVNLAPFEAMLRAIDADDRVVAVGGAKSWDDDLRGRVLAGEIAQIGYGWHLPPQLDALVAARPDVLLMSMGDLGHTQHLDRIRGFGIPVVPVFLDAETSYMGKVDYLRLVGMLTGREAQADAYVAMVADNVARLKQAAAAQPPKTVIAAWFAGGDRWMATVRNGDGQLLRDANGVNLLAEPDSPKRDAYVRIGTETLLARGREAECWIARDSHSNSFGERAVLAQFRAYRDGCMFAADGMTKPAADAFDLYETAVIRPDLVLGDLVRMLHPALRDQPFLYVRPDGKLP